MGTPERGNTVLSVPTRMVHAVPKTNAGRLEEATVGGVPDTRVSGAHAPTAHDPKANAADPSPHASPR